ncbi:bacterial regulatory helix-turn-helix, lysR family protein [Burkholderia mallei]|nr:bacterial regulatory helix-turn-helix, lysR family protein [Burkholderia mallei]KOS90771.1 bacterial regulatory helix-turn-helix, lysR family protein [Burkholderia mallei]KOS92075.1 bacterial regulatory helix-turn-helix, lysR family protein [Burkholderia mallei]KOT22761.1 bacterial regulatory helix-turn-helix, lysR family protein [Burkholderia mallei]
MARDLPPFPALRAFEAAARHESFSAAGEELHVTHGAISRQIAAFEAWLGKPVFHRHGKRVKLTDEGRRYLATVEAAFDSIAGATVQLRETGAARVLRINALPTFAMKWLLPRLSRFQREAPNVELKLSTSNAPLGSLDGFDVAIRRGPGRWPNCTSGRFLDESVIPVCSAALLKRAPIASADDLARHVLLHSDTRPDAWREWFAAAGAPLKGRKKQSFDHFYLALQAAGRPRRRARAAAAHRRRTRERPARDAAAGPAYRNAQLLVDRAARDGERRARRPVLCMARRAGPGELSARADFSESSGIADERAGGARQWRWRWHNHVASLARIGRR